VARFGVAREKNRVASLRIWVNVSYGKHDRKADHILPIHHIAAGQDSTPPRVAHISVVPKT